MIYDIKYYTGKGKERWIDRAEWGRRERECFSVYERGRDRDRERVREKK